MNSAKNGKDSRLAGRDAVSNICRVNAGLNHLNHLRVSQLSPAVSIL
jgi:hypothetical protein